MNEDALAIIGLFFVSPVCLFGYLGFRAWLSKRAEIAPTTLSPALQARFDALEATVESLTIEIERLAEGQRFVSKVLVERAAPPLSPPAAPPLAPVPALSRSTDA